MKLSTTEARNVRTENLDLMPTEEFLYVMNDEDRRVAEAVRKVIPQIALAVEAIKKSFNEGGRLIYMGAGTSGRLGVLDASECPPTFGTDPSMVVGLIAGGPKALTTAIEGAEDSAELGVKDLKAINLGPKDTLVGLAASGRTPYVIGGLDYAKSVGAATVAVSANPGAVISDHAEIAIEVDNGPEVLTGSTRLKAGTSQKLVCNMLSTASMVGIGKAYGNLMVDVQPTNVKLVDRAIRIVEAATGVARADAEAAFESADRKPKRAIVSLLGGVSPEEAQTLLDENGGFVRKAVEAAKDRN